MCVRAQEQTHTEKKHSVQIVRFDLIDGERRGRSVAESAHFHLRSISIYIFCVYIQKKCAMGLWVFVLWINILFLFQFNTAIELENMRKIVSFFGLPMILFLFLSCLFYRSLFD